jgi:penicillin-binding protein 2
MNERGLNKGSAVVLNPSNGEVLALLSLPAFDNNLFARGISQADYARLIVGDERPLFNRAIGGEFPPGSTFKMTLAVAALQEKIISENTDFLSSGGLRINQWFFPDWKAGGHGQTDVKKAIAQSVNTFFYYIGGGYDDFVGLGADKIVKYGERFGFGQQTGIDLSGEANGFLPSKEWKFEVKKEKWYIGDTYHLSIGQGDMLATPLQIAAYIGFFANGGSLYRPHLVKQIKNQANEIVDEIKTETVRKDFIDSANVNIVRQAMRQTVLDGSARRLGALKESSAGKTGTAQWSSKKDPHAWYTGFAPYENPEIAFVFLVEEGKDGSAITVSIAHDFLEWYFANY